MAASSAAPSSAKGSTGSGSRNWFHDRIRLTASPTMPTTSTVRETSASWLLAMPPNCSTGETAATIAPSSLSCVTARMMPA